jgi:hypothetical protein
MYIKCIYFEQIKDQSYSLYFCPCSGKNSFEKRLLIFRTGIFCVFYPSEFNVIMNTTSFFNVKFFVLETDVTKLFSIEF